MSFGKDFSVKRRNQVETPNGVESVKRRFLVVSQVSSILTGRKFETRLVNVKGFQSTVNVPKPGRSILT